MVFRLTGDDTQIYLTKDSTRVVGGFPDSNSALMLVCARIRYVTSRSWSDRRYMDMSRLDDNLGAAA